MRYIRKQLTVDAMQMQADGVMGGIDIVKGDFLLTHSDGSVSAMPEDVFLANYEVDDYSVSAPVSSIAERDEKEEVAEIPFVPVPKASKDMFTCVGCSQDVPASNFDRNQGLCFDCIQVKCPTCGTANKLSDMKGAYCPRCLGKPLSV